MRCYPAGPEAGSAYRAWAHRRLAAARLAGLDAVPASVRAVGEREQLELMLVENLQRQALSPLQEARAYRRLLEDGLSQADVARRVGLPAATVQQRLQILALVPEVQALYTQALATTDEQQSSDLLAEAARIVSDEDAADWLFLSTPLTAVGTNVGDFPKNSLNVRLPLAGVTVAAE